MSKTAKVALGLLLLVAVLFAAAAVPPHYAPDDLVHPSGPENAGRYLALVYCLPITLGFALAIVITRGRYRTGLLYILGALAGIVGLYLTAALAYLLLRAPS